MNILKYYLLISITSIIFAGRALAAAEIVLNSGEAFIVDIISEDERLVKANYRDQIYLIPKKEIRVIDYKKSGPHTSYVYQHFTLKDGSEIAGRIAEENQDQITIQTDIGFLTIERKNVLKIDPESEGAVEMPSRYLERENVPETRIGFSGGFLLNDRRMVESAPFTLGGGVFVEPGFLRWRDWYCGLRTDYSIARGSASEYAFFNTTAYGIRSYKSESNPILNFYFSAGLGFSSVRYQTDQKSAGGLDRVLEFQAGWQGLQSSSWIFRAGLTERTFVEDGRIFAMIGFSFSFGF